MTGGRGTRGPGRDNMVSGVEFAGLGVQFALTILLFVFFGLWLDRRLGTSPWFVLICVFVGAGGAFYSMIRQVTRHTKRMGNRSGDDKGSGT